MIVRTLIGRGTIVVGAVVCAVVGAAAPDARQPIPRECPAVLSGPTDLVGTWRPRAGMTHGYERFDRPAVLVFPSGVETVDVELWGGGGGGGGGSGDALADGGAGGGGGASGAYARGTVHLSSGNSYLLIIGPGGNGGSAGSAGQRGAASVLCENGLALMYAGGGPGGAPAITEHAGLGGRWHDADVTPPTDSDVLQRIGHDGHRGAIPLFELRGLGGPGGTAVAGSIEGLGSTGGEGGAGAMEPEIASAGASGAGGLAVVIW